MALAWAMGPVPTLLAQTVSQFQVAPGSTTAARICAASAAGTVMVMREPETLTGIDSKADGPSVLAADL